MARHPMSCSWPQLAARPRSSERALWLAYSGAGGRTDGSGHDHECPGRGDRYSLARVHGDGALCLWKGVRAPGIE